MGGELSPEVVDFVAQNARTWFSDLGDGAVRVVVEQSVRRLRSLVVTLRLQAGADSDRARQVVVKSELPGGPPLADRPSLGIGPAELTGKHHLEWNGLVAAWDAFGKGRYPGLGAVRPLAHLPWAGAMIVTHVEEPTLRLQLRAASRLGVTRRRPDLTSALFGLGRWLRAFHRLMPTVASVRASPHERAELAAAYAQFLDRHNPTAADLARHLVNIAAHVEPAMGLGLGHGDFAPRNVFIATTGEVKVIDILARWRVPIYEDIAFLLTELRMAGPELILRGHAFPRGYQDSLEASFLHGYVAEADVTLHPAAVAWYQAIVIVDKCAAAATRATLPGQQKLRSQLVSRRLDDETARVSATLRALVE